MGLDLHIEELVLHGFPARDRHRIAEAMQLELSRLLAESDRSAFSKGPISLEGVNAGTLEIKAGAKPQATGRQIARAVFRGLGRSSAPPSLHPQAPSRSPSHSGGNQL